MARVAHELFTKSSRLFAFDEASKAERMQTQNFCRLRHNFLPRVGSCPPISTEGLCGKFQLVLSSQCTHIVTLSFPIVTPFSKSNCLFNPYALCGEPSRI